MRVLILAAGQGKRMNSKIPKVAHKILDKPMVNWVIDVAQKVSEEIAIVLGNGFEIVKQLIDPSIAIFEQKEQLGTAHAVMCAKDFLKKGDNILILYGDVPFISKETLDLLQRTHIEHNNDATVLSVVLDDPTGYGRIIKNSKNQLIKIVEDKDSSENEKNIKEVNTGIAIFNSEKLKDALDKVKPQNVQGEYYLTDVFLFLDKTEVIQLENNAEVLGVNDRIQLAEVERKIRMEIMKKLMLSGVTIVDPYSTYISPDVEIGIDTIIQPQTFIYGRTIIGENCEIGPLTRILNCKIGNKVKIIRSECELSEIKDNVKIGPFSRLREGTFLEENVKIGNFVEIKKTHIATNSKAQHLTYLGDTYVGKNVNIGAGTITCNYDGRKKYETFIDDDSFIGSNASLVAPVKIGKNTLIGAGSVITKDVPDDSLALGRAQQVNKLNWVKEKWKNNLKGE
ncbi:MAG TPA: bifunctional UDP-N-acetylglucosamine diphosphorylase/glucosamine-1-phosphate N-acetyltransferase GlmU [Defluviitoga sp.]|nr:bifunctional UDP-N-acetylglucosamine diphosphorylase/glucosamine-1-phosphate N-acetyltransferase GlmU [Defluviitoga sp.]HOP25049.1 bifunctional UDP-N-acetylglucosamine diphosphorylase/glucosamine-1-phosphate N-acetyltransferase GlmU [Defluviitoga sp.]HPZ29201.1 bifunctional UDP-N-acetylglucosamine diphosphorylase/glucosamine-1-phosphate N-acetyltransferase GlmU [Defluviitoga sp.]HQD63108.1 bifunctional UDP-N-acetylglucosamine diphosphorylase/glucosamine-1-phosphate N-acetyltransferase GlmU [D